MTRQLAGFFHTHPARRPDAILLNGGVFNSPAIASRLVEVVSSWWPGALQPIRVLQHESLELAVARGAAWYGLVRRGMGRRIGGGAAHSFYVGLETKRGQESSALCLIPRGHEEGQTVELGGRTFNLTLEGRCSFRCSRRLRIVWRHPARLSLSPTSFTRCRRSIPC